ncbi:hypothetical protein BCD48_43520 [Pseudofrankia sp. BMG5.36]|nr:hypothetical protein BCD48_43520 [Pseudofrankia sp. BMG5.36]
MDKTLLRNILTVVHTASGWRDEEEKRRLGRLDELLVAHAEAVLGRHLDTRHLQVDALVDLLRDDWLPHADPTVLAAFAEIMWFEVSSPADRAASLDTTADQLAFLRRRYRTSTFRLNLRRAFLDAHKRQVPVTARPDSPDRVEPDREPWLLAGVGVDDPRVPYPFQEDAWRALDALADGMPVAGRRAGLVVLPTGAGKTYTAVRWLLRRMAADPRLRVLWIADQQELVDQAARTFVDLAGALPVTFERTLRRIHSLASASTTIVDDDNDVVVVTRASVTGGKAAVAARRRLGRFLAGRSCVIVVDEAHHAVAASYEALLDHVFTVADPVLVGLTATPWPAGDGARRLRARFPVKVADVRARELIESGVLARPLFRVVDTQERPALTADELASMGVGGDLPASVLRRLDRDGRNGLVVDTWLARRDTWGKTLLFAVDIEHADRLGARFHSAGVPTRVVHSGLALERAARLAWFKAQTDDCVLVSVGMLTEGVDLPDARTAFLARPTRSRVLMHQMVGRVLRGIRSGGESVAYVVDLRDQWADDLGVPHPWDVLGAHADIEIDAPSASSGRGRLPRVPDELTDTLITPDILSELRRRYSEQAGPVITDMAVLTAATLTGYYELGDRNIPVFGHTQNGFRELVDACASGAALDVRWPIEVFGDVPVPRPSDSDVTRFVDYLRAEGVEPPFVPIRATYDLRAVAQDLANAGPMTTRQKRAWLSDRYDSGLAGLATPGFRQFCEVVERALFELDDEPNQLAGPAGDPENPRHRQNPRSALSRPLPPLVPVAERDLAALLKRVCLQGRDLLADPPDLAARLEPVPTIAWTRRPIRHAQAYWAPRIAGKGRGTPIIRVNRQLCARPDQIPDVVLEYLLWHEMLHQVLPGHGHDAEFRRLEALWPDADLHDHALDTLAERFDLDDRS